MFIVVLHQTNITKNSQKVDSREKSLNYFELSLRAVLTVVVHQTNKHHQTLWRIHSREQGLYYLESLI